MSSAALCGNFPPAFRCGVIPHNIVCGALRIFFADSASSSLAIHKVWLRLSSLIRQKISRKSSLPNCTVLPALQYTKYCCVNVPRSETKLSRKSLLPNYAVLPKEACLPASHWNCLPLCSRGSIASCGSTVVRSGYPYALASAQIFVTWKSQHASPFASVFVR